MSVLRQVVVLGAVSVMVAACCGGGRTEGIASEGASSGKPAPAEAPKAGQAPAAAAGDVKATKIARPLADVSQDDLKAALEKGGWKINGSTQTKSAMLAINITAEKAGTKAEIKYYNPSSDFWIKTLAKDDAAIHKDGSVALGVIIKGDKASAERLLASLVGG